MKVKTDNIRAVNKQWTEPLVWTHF